MSDIDELEVKVQRLDLQVGDVLVLSAKQHLPESAHRYLRSTLSAVAPGHRVIVLDGGMQLAVLTAAQIAARTVQS
ncbi:MAG: hypothetical protein V4477_16905 [Pseudomonadota bacterium]